MWYRKMIANDKKNLLQGWLDALPKVFVSDANGEMSELRVDLQLFANGFDELQPIEDTAKKKMSPQELKDEKALAAVRQTIEHELSVETFALGVREKRLLELMIYPGTFTINVPSVGVDVIASPKDFKPKDLNLIDTSDMVKLARRYVNNIDKFVFDSSIPEQYKHYFKYLFANHPINVIRYTHNGDVYLLPSLESRVNAAVEHLGKNNIVAQQILNLWVGYDTFHYENIDTIEIFSAREEELLSKLRDGDKKDPLGYTEKSLLNALGLNQETSRRIRKLIYEKFKVKYENQRFSDFKKLLEFDYGSEESRMAKALGCSVEAIEAVKYLLWKNGTSLFCYEYRGEMYVVLNTSSALNDLSELFSRKLKDDLTMRRILGIIEWIKAKNEEEHQEKLAEAQKVVQDKQKSVPTHAIAPEHGQKATSLEKNVVTPVVKPAVHEIQEKKKQHLDTPIRPLISFEQIDLEVELRQRLKGEREVTPEMRYRNDILSLCYETKMSIEEVEKAYKAVGQNIDHARKVLSKESLISDEEAHQAWKLDLFRTYNKDVVDLALTPSVLRAGLGKEYCKKVYVDTGADHKKAKQLLEKEAQEINDARSKGLRDLYVR